MRLLRDLWGGSVLIERVVIAVSLIAIVAFSAAKYQLHGHSPQPVFVDNPAVQTPQTTDSAAGVTVSVTGAVKKPGSYTLAPNTRVQDAIAAAGGTRPDADPAELNLVAYLRNGERVTVPFKKQ